MSITIYHYLAVVLVAVAVVAGLLLGPARRVDEARPDVVVRAARAVRTRNLIAFIAALVVGITAVATGWGAPRWDVYQQIVEIAPFAGASAALIAVIVHPTSIVPSSPGPRTAAA